MTDYDTFSKLFRLDLETGQLFWNKAKPNVPFGTGAGHCDATGYRRISVNHKMYLAHRIVFLLVYGHWPQGVCDHVDRNPRNNHPHNLRDVPRGDNVLNSKVRVDNTTGAKGLYFNSIVGRWEVRKRGKHLGSFVEKDKAIQAYEEAP